MHPFRIIILFLFILSTKSFGGQAEAKQVFNKLILAIGNSSIPKPTLFIMDNSSLVAKTFPSGDVMIGKQFIRYCSRFGADSVNALACVLSHELVHYYQKHFWAQKFGSAYVDSDWGKKISEDENNKKYLELYETQADQLGFYFSFSAGYKTWKVAQPLLDSIYHWYHLSDQLTGYPSLSQRKEMVQTSATKIAELIPVFEISNQLKVISAVYLGDQQSALLDFSMFGYEHLISANIQTAEMFNNIAVAKILKAQKFSASLYSGLQLPVILDQSSLMYEASGTKGDDDEQDKFIALMNEALENLEKALKLDANYWPASVNKSLVLLGLEKYGSCEDELSSKAITNQLKNNKSLENILTEIKGILYYSKGDSIQGKRFFMTAKKNGSLSAKINELILKDQSDQIETGNMASSGIDTIEKWNGKVIYKGLKSYRTGTNHVITYNNNKAELLQDSSGGYKIFELRQKIGLCPLQYVKVAVKYNPQTTTSRGLKTGQTSNDLISKYGKTNTKVIGTLYTYWLYPKQNLIVTVNNTDNKVDGWFYYMLD